MISPKKFLCRAAALLLAASCFLSAVPARHILADTAVENDNSDFVWPSGPSVYADAAIVMEVTTGLILYEKDIYTAYYPASITKVLTALLALENCSLNEIVTMSEAAEQNVYGSRIGLVAGEQVSMEDALYGMLLESANEVSYAIGEHVAAKVNQTSGSMEEFSALMNARTAELGCTNSNFINSNGLHEDEHYTCAYDMALIGKEAIAIPAFRKIAGTRTYTIPATNKNVARPLANHHRFIRKTLTYTPAIAGKTGGTTEALTTLVTFAEKDGLTLVAVVLHVDTPLHAYEDTTKILDFAFDNYSLYSIKDSELNLDLNFPALFSVTQPFASGLDTLIRVGENSNVILPNSASFSDARKTITYTPIEEFVHGDNVIGQIAYQFAGKNIGFADILYYNPDYPVTRAEFEALWPSYLIPPELVFKADESGSYVPINSSSSDTIEASDPDGTKKEQSSLPAILGIAAALVVLLGGYYYIFVELPHKRKRKEYRRRHNARVGAYKKDSHNNFR